MLFFAFNYFICFKNVSIRICCFLIVFVENFHILRHFSENFLQINSFNFLAAHKLVNISWEFPVTSDLETKLFPIFLPFLLYILIVFHNGNLILLFNFVFLLTVNLSKFHFDKPITYSLFFFFLFFIFNIFHTFNYLRFVSEISVHMVGFEVDNPFAAKLKKIRLRDLFVSCNEMSHFLYLIY